MNHIPQFESSTRFRLQPADRITFDGTEFRHQRTDIHGHVLVQVDQPDIAQHFSHQDFYRLLVEDRIIVAPGWYRATAVAVRAAHSGRTLTDLPTATLKLVLWKQAYCDVYLAMQEEDRQLRRAARRISKSTPSLRGTIPVMAERIALLEASRSSPGRRCGAEVGVRVPPKPSTLRGWLKRYERAGFDPMALVDGRGRGGNRTPRTDPVAWSVATPFIEAYVDQRRPTKIMLFRQYQAELKRVNLERAESQLNPIPGISRRTFEIRIDELDPFRCYAGRHGVEAAKRKFGAILGGVDVMRPLERVELDEWKVSLFTLLESAGALEVLSIEMREKIARARVWLSAAIDVRTKCILALRLSPSAPSSVSAIATIEMILTDKTELGKALGAETHWEQGGRFETLAMDAGAAFVDARTHAAVRAIGSEPFHPPAGLPGLRGSIERVFRTFQGHWVKYFTGQSFEHVLAKGDYDGEGNASMDLFLLNQTLVRYVVDAYHNTPHAGLGGETPADCWRRLTAKYPVLPPPDKKTRRHIFGRAFERRIQNTGIRIFGIDYQSQELQQCRRTIGQGTILVRADLFDLGEVSVRIDGKLRSVKPAVPGLDLRGVSVWEWQAASRELCKMFRQQAEVSADVVNRALSSIRATSQASIERAGLLSPMLSQDECEKFDRDLVLPFRIAQGFGTEPVDAVGVAPDLEPVMDILEGPASIAEDDDEFGFASTPRKKV